MKEVWKKPRILNLAKFKLYQAILYQLKRSILTNSDLNGYRVKRKFQRRMNIELKVTSKRNFRFFKVQKYPYLYKMDFLMN